MIEICGTVIKQDISLGLKFLISLPEKESHWHAFKSPDFIAHISLWKFFSSKFAKGLPKFFFMPGKRSSKHIRLPDLIGRSKWSCIAKICKRYPLIHKKSSFFCISKKCIDIQHFRCIWFPLAIHTADPSIFQADSVFSPKMDQRKKTLFFFQFRNPLS